MRFISFMKLDTWIVLFFCLLPGLWLMKIFPLFPSHDGLYHIGRILEYKSAIENGQFPPRLAPNLLNEAGYPLFVVNYHLPYLFASLLMFMKVDVFNAYKIILSLSFIGGAIGMYFFLKHHSKDPVASLTGSIVFSYLPYRFANIYTRGAFGESVAIGFVPFILLAFLFIQEGKKSGKFLLALGVFGLIASHTGVFLLFLPFFTTLVFWFRYVRKETMQDVFWGLLFGIGSSAFQIVPALFEKKFIQFDNKLNILFLGHFLTFAQIFRIPFTGVNISSPFQIGLTGLIIILISVVLLMKYKNNVKKQLGFYLIWTIISLFVTNSISKNIWKYEPLRIYVLYPWRFLSLTVLCISVLSSYFVQYINQKMIVSFFLIFFTIYSSRHYFLRPTQIVSNQATETLTTENEFDTTWMNKNTLLDANLVQMNETIPYETIKKTPFDLLFNFSVTKKTNVVFRKLYYPGWVVLVDGKKITIQKKDGLVSIDLPLENKLVHLYYEGTITQKMGNFISLFSLSFIFVFLMAEIKKKLQKFTQ